MGMGKKNAGYVPNVLLVLADPGVRQAGHQIRAVKVSKRWQEAHLDRLVQARRGLRFEILLVELTPSSEVHAEVEPELRLAVLQQNLVPADTADAVVAG